MPSALQNSLFAEILAKKAPSNIIPLAIMGEISCSDFSEEALFNELPLVVFDFETTGLDVRSDRIIEIGAIKYVNQKEVDRLSLFINPGRALSADIQRITGITPDMLADAPSSAVVLPRFHAFLRGCMGVAHNAEFDCGMLNFESLRLGISCDYFVVCTLKMARQLLNIERRNLDALAAHFGLTFESRHRSIGDIQVTAQVLWRLLGENPQLRYVKDFSSFREVTCWQTIKH